MKNPSFNSWIKLQTTHTNPDIRALSNKWVVTRGRLTRTSVEMRSSTDYGLGPGVGWDAYAEYLTALSPPPAETDDGAVLSLDPSL